ncbi:hypothetical protein T484DRAFT_2017740, partial [Baffinella frigidus]
MVFPVNTPENTDGNGRPTPNPSQNMHLNLALSQMASAQRPAQGIDYSNTPWSGATAPAHGSFQQQHSMSRAASATSNPAFPSQSNNNLLATIQQQAAAFSSAYNTGLFGQIDPQASLQRTAVSIPVPMQSATSRPLTSAPQPLYNHPANNLSSLLRANSLQRASVYAASPQVYTNMTTATLMPAVQLHVTQAVPMIQAPPSITLHGVRVDAHKACKIFQLRSKSTAGDDPLDQAAAGRSTVVAEMMHVPTKAVRDIWSRSVGAEMTRSLWTEHEKLLDSCDKFRTATGIATSENRRSGPSKAVRTAASLQRSALGRSETSDADAHTPALGAIDDSASPRPEKRARADIVLVPVGDDALVPAADDEQPP